MGWDGGGAVACVKLCVWGVLGNDRGRNDASNDRARGAAVTSNQRRCRRRSRPCCNNSNNNNNNNNTQHGVMEWEKV